MTLGLSDGTTNFALSSCGTSANINNRLLRPKLYGTSVGNFDSSTSYINSDDKGIGVVTDSAKSGLVADISFVNGWAPTFCIKA